MNSVATQSLSPVPGGIPMPPADVDPSQLPPSITLNRGADLIEWLQNKQEESPVWRDSFGIFHVFRASQVFANMADHEHFSSDINRLSAGSGDFGGSRSLMLTDPPVHRKLRTLLSRSFTPRMAAALEPRIERLAEEALSAIEVDEFDFVEAFTYPLPIQVIGELLGVPVSDRDLFREWADRLIGLHVADPSSMDVPGMVGRAMSDMGAYLSDHVRQRRRAPAQDLISELALAGVDGERLADSEIVNMACLLLLAGQITSTMALGNTLLRLAEAPAVQKDVVADPGLVPALFEEVLRMSPPLTQAARITTTDLSLGGHSIPANSIVIHWLLAANYDRSAVAHPQVLDPARPAKHFAFGHGVHYCFGAPLARAEARIALTAVFRRFPRIRVADLGAVTMYEDPMFGPKFLPVSSGAA